MKFNQVFLAAMATLAMTSAMAEGKKFEGLALGVDLGFTGASSEFTDTGTSSKGELGQHSMPIKLDASYGFEMSPNVITSVGLTYGFGDTKAGQSIDTTTGDNIISFKLSKNYSVYVAPGFKLNDQSLLYVKLAYESASLARQLTTAAAESVTVTGSTYAVGLKQSLDKSMYFKVEAGTTTYGGKLISATDTTETKPKLSYGSVGIGFQF